MKIAIALLGLLAFSPAAFADNPQLYRWTDAQGVIHYSDQPPHEPVADLATSDIPVFPAVDQAQVDKEQAALLAQATALQQLAQVQAAQQAQAAAIAEQQAELDASIQAQQAAAQQQTASAQPIYIRSAFIPRAYRANLYISSGPSGTAHALRALPSRPAVSILQKP